MTNLEKEDWAESQAKFFDRLADDLEGFIPGWEKKQMYGECIEIQGKAKGLRLAASQLRRSKDLRLEAEAYERLTSGGSS